MDEEVQSAEVLIDSGEYRVHLRVGCHVAREHQRRLAETSRQLLNVFFETALIGEHETRAARGGRLRNRPCDRTLVGHADNEADFTREVHGEVMCASSATRRAGSAASLTSRIAVLDATWSS